MVEDRPKWKSDSLALMRRRQKENRWTRRISIAALSIYPLLILGHLVDGHYWRVLVDVLLAFVLYRCWLSFRRRERGWTEVLHHALRMQVETDERFLWHSQQLDRALEELKRF